MQSNTIPIKRKYGFRNKVIALLLSGSLILSPIAAQALSTSWIKYIQYAQKVLTLIKSGGLGSINLDNLGDFLTLFKDIPIQELQDELQNFQDIIDSLDPQTKELIGSISSTLGQLGIPIPSQINSLVSSISDTSDDGYNSPFGLSHDQALLAALNISSDSVSGSVLGENGQDNIDKILQTSQNAWQTGADIMQINGTSIVADSVGTAVDAQLSFSSQDVLKAITIQNAQQTALNQQMGASNAEQGKIAAMGVNLQAKQLAIGAQSLQLQTFQANKLAAAEGARMADTQGAFTTTMTNAYMFSCLSSSDCK